MPQQIDIYTDHDNSDMEFFIESHKPKLMTCTNKDKD